MATKRQSSVPQKSSSRSRRWTPWADDPILQEIYATREKISAECGHDLQKIYEYFERKRAAGKFRHARDKPVGRRGTKVAA
jgi:hypothetical protein